MQKLSIFIVSVLLLIGGFVNAQTYHIIIKGGHLIDPKNNINDRAVEVSTFRKLCRH